MYLTTNDHRVPRRVDNRSSYTIIEHAVEQVLTRRSGVVEAQS